MRLCYVDESCTADFYGFAAVVADAHQTMLLTKRMNEIVAALDGDYGIGRATELHAYPMFHGKEAWSDVPVRVRVRAFEQVIDAVQEAGVDLLLRAVHCGRLRERQARSRYPEFHPPEQVAFQHLLQRIDEIALRDRTHALVIADERTDRERHRDRFAVYQLHGTPGSYLSTRLGRLLDTVHFAPSHHSRMLQVADVVAFIWRRAETVTESDPRQARTMTRLIQAVHDRAYKPGVWP